MTLNIPFEIGEKVYSIYKDNYDDFKSSVRESKIMGFRVDKTGVYAILKGYENPIEAISKDKEECEKRVKFINEQTKD